MEYLKIKASLDRFEDRLNRTLYVRSDLNLIALGCVLSKTFGATLEHFFLFRKDRISYLPECFSDGFWDPEYDRLMKDYTIKDLGNKFIYEYDTGEGWTFQCKVYKVKKEIDAEQFAFLVDGKGLGIFEDDRYTFERYLMGEISPDYTGETEEDLRDDIYPCYLPWNLNMEKFGDFDDGFDLEFEKDAFFCESEAIYDEYLSMNHEEGYELTIPPFEWPDYMDEYLGEGIE